MAKPAPYILHLTARPRGWGAKRFREASSKKNIKIRTADPARAMLEIGRGTGSVRINSRKFTTPSVVLPRFGPGNYENGLAMLAHLEASGIPVCNSSHSIALARDTYRTLHELQKAGLVVPVTARILSIKDLRIAIKSIPGPPWILKTFTGAMGIGTMLVHKKDQVEAIAATLWALKQPILMQEFIKSVCAGSFDTRVLIVGGKVLGAIRRSAAIGEFRANVHRGGTPEPASLTKKENRLALKAARVIGLDVAGVDWLETPDGPVFLEVNATPGFQGFESATGIDVAGACIDFAWSLAR
jgi:ribosomal protein S6--L-glutamate ligase